MLLFRSHSEFQVQDSSYNIYSIGKALYVCLAEDLIMLLSGMKRYHRVDEPALQEFSCQEADEFPFGRKL